MFLIEPPVGFRTFQFHAQRTYCAPDSTPSDRNDPGKAGIDQCRRLGLFGEQPHEFNRAFLAPLEDSNLFRTGQSLVASHTFEGVAKRAAADCGDGGWIVAFNALL